MAWKPKFWLQLCFYHCLWIFLFIYHSGILTLCENSVWTFFALVNFSFVMQFQWNKSHLFFSVYQEISEFHKNMFLDSFVLRFSMHHFRTSVEFYFMYRLNFYAVILWNIPQKFFLSFCSDETFLFCFFEDGQKKEMLVAGLTFFFSSSFYF